MNGELVPHRPRRASRPPWPRSTCRPARSSSPASGSPPSPAASRAVASPRPPRPAPAGPGSRAAPVTAARSRPAACRPCCPADVRVAAAEARADLAAAWGVPTSCRPKRPRHRRRSSPPPPRGELGALVVGGVELDDLPDPAAARDGPDARSTSSSASRCASSDVTALADVVLPVAPAGREGRHVRQLGGPPAALRRGPASSRASLTDMRVLAGIAEELGRPLGFRTVAAGRAPMAELGPWDGKRAGAPRPQARPPAKPAAKTGRARHLAAARRRRSLPGRQPSTTGHRPRAGAARQRGDPAAVRRRPGRVRRRSRPARRASPRSSPRSPTCPTASSGRPPTPASTCGAAARRRPRRPGHALGGRSTA